MDKQQHFTQPPARYTEATLVKAMEEKGVGRPSTYAATISTIEDRDYVVKQDKRLAPTGLGEVVTGLMKDKFKDIVDVGFTASMENRLDDVEAGKQNWKALLADFYRDFEKELKDALMDNIQKFLLELGNGFAFVGREYRIEIGSTENFIDMLFYHIRLHCYVVVEVKVTEFESFYAGQLGTYVVAVNHQLKTEKDEPTLGLLVCKSKDDIKAQYALEASSQPLGVSAYELSKLIPENFKGSLPSIDEIESELRKDTEG